ncbi:MAG: hypothetical protein OES69_16235, partial [Myxococcales bacterium]|nr:hypothetical protein [Myxococcales bacterium]
MKRRTWNKIPGPLRVIILIALILIKIVLLAVRLGEWISTNFVLRDRKLRWIARSPRFYWHPAWRAIVVARRIENIATYGRLTCEHCFVTGARYHCDHVNPRSTHPEDGLNYKMTQMLCEKCNVEKGNRWIGRGRKWRRNPRLAAAA